MGMKEDLDILEAKINKLKVDYEQYFAKTLKREPAFLREEIDRLILRYSSQPITNTALKFRFSTLTSKYASYKQFWGRVLRQIEEGTYLKGGAFGAKAPETPPECGVRAQGEDIAGDSKFSDIYRQYIDARKRTNEMSRGMTYEEFARAITQQTDKIRKEFKCNEVEYKVVVKDGKAKITLIPSK